MKSKLFLMNFEGYETEDDVYISMAELAYLVHLRRRFMRKEIEMRRWGRKSHKCSLDYVAKHMKREDQRFRQG